ncbi:MAG TPA: hypothetical protein VK137_15885 [Planctomycetaceae bacterium]|nr:hypothetical protein [Planctomycetaceae bacterium]
MHHSRTQAPTANELAASPFVVHALNLAWLQSQPDDPNFRHEEGGWIYLNLTTGEMTTLRATRGGQASVNLSHPPHFTGAVVVGKFHTHPNPSWEGWEPGPSASDDIVNERDGVPDLIRADDGIYFSGPERRRGGLWGEPGFPT